jgi:SAM-dependent methyltransferase
MDNLERSTYEYYNAFIGEDYFLEAEKVKETNPAEIAQILNYIPQKSRLLDVGCGSCPLFSEISRKSEYFGVDISFQGLLRAQRNFVGFHRTTQGYAHQLPFKEGIFDVVLSMYSLEHFLRPKVFFDEILRVCKGQGRIIIISPAWERPQDFPPSIKDFLKSPLRKASYIAGRFFRYLILCFFPKKYFFLTLKYPLNSWLSYSSDRDTIYAVNIREIVNYFRAKSCRIIYLRRVIRNLKQPFIENILYNLKTIIKNNPYRKYFGTRLFIVVEKLNK